MGSATPNVVRLKVTSWHATLFFQIFSLMIFLGLGAWYTIVAAAPGYISEYLPAESPANATTILGDFIVAIIWLVIIYFTWKQRKAAFLGSIAVTLFFLIFVSIDFLYAKSFVSAPDFSDFLWYPVSVLIIVFSLRAYKSSPRLA